MEEFNFNPNPPLSVLDLIHLRCLEDTEGWERNNSRIKVIKITLRIITYHKLMRGPYKLVTYYINLYSILFHEITSLRATDHLLCSMSHKELK